MRLNDPDRLRQLTSAAGKKAHADGTAHKFTSEEAREAGRKGGLQRAANRKSASFRSSLNGRAV